MTNTNEKINEETSIDVEYTQEDIERITEEAAKTIDKAFASGKMKDKYDDLKAISDNGDALVFEGSLSWAIISDEDIAKYSISGNAPSLDIAVEDMMSCLLSALEDEKNSDLIINFLINPIEE